MELIPQHLVKKEDERLFEGFRLDLGLVRTAGS
jgi:hypothetical protein